MIQYAIIAILLRMKFYSFIFGIFIITTACFAVELDFYKPSLEKLPWDEIIIPTKEGIKIKIILKTKNLKEFSDSTYQIKLFREDDYPNGKFKTIELKQTKNINEFIGETTINTDLIPQGDDGIPEICSAEGAPDGGWEAEYFLEKLVKRGYKSRGNATFFSFTDEGTVEEHENEGVPVLNNEYIQSAGVEKIIIDAGVDNSNERPYYITPLEWNLPGFNPAKDWLLVKNQADIFYYSFHGEHESVGTLIAKVMSHYGKMPKNFPSEIVPRKTSYMLDEIFYRDVSDEIGTNWNFDLEWVFLAGCSVLDYDGEVVSQWANFHHKRYNHWYDSRPGLFWAKNLLNKDSNLHGLIGFCATGKSDHPMIDECFNHNDSIVKGWTKNESFNNMFIAPAILYHPECENDTFSNLDDYNPESDKLTYWYTYKPATYAFPERKRISEIKTVDLNVNPPRAPDCLMVENIPCLSLALNETNMFVFNYYPAFFPERENISDKRIEIENLTPLLGWGYFSPYPQVNIIKDEDVFFLINPGVIDFEQNNMKNYGTNTDGLDDQIITQWNIQVFNHNRKLIVDEIFQSPLKKSNKPNLLCEASYQVKPNKKLWQNSLHYFRVRGKKENGFWSPFSRIQWFKTK